MDTIFDRPDNPRVLARPPLLYGCAFVAVLVLRWLWPLPPLARSIALPVGAALLALGIGVVLWGRKAMLAAGTNIDPTLPTTAIVVSGPFQFSRNPLYVALTLVYRKRPANPS